MCDDATLDDAEEAFSSGKITRRDLARFSGILALSSLLPTPAWAAEVAEQDVSVTTPAGQADCYFVHPTRGTHPGIIIWPDVLGLRPAFQVMGKRLAQSGYSVLVVNPYYRMAPAPVVSVGASFRDPETRDIVLPLARSLSPQTNVEDAKAFVHFLDAQSAVDTTRGIGTMGYCMGGPMTVRAAAAIPERIKAGASFHGGGLVTDAPDSPHRLVADMDAGFLFAIAENDDEKQPTAKDELRDAFAAANLTAEIEVYRGALHGWCPPDSQVYNDVQAERAWSRLLHLFETQLV
jgi:carboxymethylenebutenolidase